MSEGSVESATAISIGTKPRDSMSWHTRGAVGGAGVYLKVNDYECDLRYIHGL